MSVIEDSDTSRFPRGPAATLEDVWNCYRLLLDREPDEGGFETHAEVVRNGISVDDLWRLFVSSPEYARRTKLHFEPTVTRLPFDGFDLFVPEGGLIVGEQILTEDNYEPHLTRAIQSAMRPGQVFLEIGANIGYFAMLASLAVRASGRVIAFEPMAHNVSLLLANVKINSATNVVVLPFAASDEDGFATALPSGSLASPESPELDDLTSLGGREIVYCRTIDAAAPRDRPVDIAKINIDGFDYKAIVGAQETLKQSHPQVFAKFAPTLLAEVSRIEPLDYLRLFQNIGYNDFSVLRRDGDAQSMENNVEAILQLSADNDGAPIDLHIRRT